jgi:hypothetical protein
MDLTTKTLSELKAIASERGIIPTGHRGHKQTWIRAIENSLGAEVAQEPIEIQVQEPIEIQAQELIALAAENPPGVDRLVENFTEVHCLPDCNFSCAEIVGAKFSLLELLEVFPGVEVELVAEAIEVQADCLQERKSFSGSDLIGITLSDRFLFRYFPPQSQIFHFQPDVDGQLSLLDFEVELTDEPPDPDDFESLDAFREAIAIWDASHPDLIEIGFDSFREWAPCPDNWYESAVSIELFEMLELSEPEPSKRCPCGAMPAFQCDGTTATHIYSDRIIFTPCYKNNLDGIQFDFNFCDRVGARAPPGGDAVF